MKKTREEKLRKRIADLEDKIGIMSMEILVWMQNTKMLAGELDTLLNSIARKVRVRQIAGAKMDMQALAHAWEELSKGKARAKPKKAPRPVRVEKNLHLHFSLPAILKNWTPKQWTFFANIQHTSPARLKKCYRSLAEEGYTVVPRDGVFCEGFDRHLGCMGHIEKS